MKNNHGNNAEKPKRIKKSYAFKPNIVQLIETHKYVHDDREIDFVSEAIRNYCADIDGEKSLDVLCYRITQIVSAEVQCQTNRMVHMLFKIAVEMAIQNHLLAAGYVNMDDAEMRFIRNLATDNVRKSRGFLSFEQVLADEKAYSNGN